LIIYNILYIFSKFYKKFTENILTKGNIPDILPINVDLCKKEKRIKRRHKMKRSAKVKGQIKTQSVILTIVL